MRADFGEAVRESEIMKTLDTIILATIWLIVPALSAFHLFQRSRGRFTGYGQTGALPESWRRWLLGEKRAQR